MNEQLFSGRAEHYEKSRPNCATESIEYLCSLVPANAVFADIGAGTGKFTSLIAKRGYTIYAVEPNNEMRQVLINNLRDFSNVIVLNNNAEDTKLASSSIDIVVTVTALHWFDLSAFRSECQRILKPNGQIVAIYNSRKNEVRDRTSHPDKTAAEIFFGEQCEIKEFPNPQYYSRERFISYHLSHTTSPKLEDDNYELFLKELNSIFECDSHNEKYFFDFITLLYMESKCFLHSGLIENHDTNT